MRTLILACLPLVCAIGCNDGLGLPTEAATCASYKDLASCIAQPACAADKSCPTCDHPSADFIACYAKGQEPIPNKCTAVACAPRCEDATQASACLTTNGCTAVYTLDTTAFAPTMKFASCHSGLLTCASQSTNGCPPFAPANCLSGFVVGYANGCPVGCIEDSLECGGAESACAGRSEQSCTSVVGCHAVYDDPGTCDCSTPGCCIQYKTCKAGPAMCKASDVLCDATPPACGPNYVVSYTSSCYEGCVKPMECAGL